MNPDTSNQSLFCHILTGVRHNEALPSKINRGQSLVYKDFVAILYTALLIGRFWLISRPLHSSKVGLLHADGYFKLYTLTSLHLSSAYDVINCCKLSMKKLLIY